MCYVVIRYFYDITEVMKVYSKESSAKRYVTNAKKEDQKYGYQILKRSFI